jgi:hypothetical protein
MHAALHLRLLENPSPSGAPPRSYPPTDRVRAEGKEVNRWKWPSKLEIQIGIIALLVLMIWIMLQHPARWG